MSKLDPDQVLALAGIFQAAHMAQQLAHHGIANETAMNASIASILKIEAETTTEVYDKLDNLKIGLKNLRDKLKGGSSQEDIEVARYVLGIILLAKKLRKQGKLLDAITQGIDTVQSQREFFSQDSNYPYLHPSILAKLADLYTQTISTLMPRIMVSGDQLYLTNTAIANKIRGCLFAGIRSAFLWQQLGGSRWQLLFSRKKIIESADTILDSLQA